MNVAASIVDFESADRAAERIVLAYELADILSDFSDEAPGQYAAALTVAQVVVAFGLLNVKVPEKVATAEFAKVYRAVRRQLNRLGRDARLRDIITEMSLKQGKR